MSLSGVGAYFRKRTQDSRDFGGLRIRGIFVFSEDKVSFLFQFREERKVGVRWGGALWFERSKRSGGAVGGEVVCGWM